MTANKALSCLERQQSNESMSTGMGMHGSSLIVIQPLYISVSLALKEDS